jgi:Fungal trichothecene efflux pump (TRI12)
MGANFWSVSAFWPIQAQELFGPGVLSISYDVLPYGYGIIAGIFVFNWAVSLWPKAIREILTIAAAIMTGSIGAMGAVTPSTPALGRSLSFLASFGSGGLVSPTITILTCICAQEFAGTLTAIMVSIRYLGASIGYAIYFSVLQRKLAGVLPTNVATAAINAGLPVNQTAGFVTALLGSNQTALATYGVGILEAGMSAVRTSYEESFKLVYFVSIAFGGTAFVGCLFLGNVKKYIVEGLVVDIH